MAEQEFNEPPGEEELRIPWREIFFGRRTLTNVWRDLVDSSVVFSSLFTSLLWCLQWDRSLGNFFVALATVVGSLLAAMNMIRTRRLSEGPLRTFDLEFKESPLRALALSLAYLGDLKRRSRNTRAVMSVGLYACVIKGGVLHLPAPADMDAARMAFVLQGCMTLTLINELVTELRIWKGWFGTTQWEARALVRFLLDNAADVDFFDGDGKRRRVLLPEAPESRQSATVGVRDGVTI